VKLGLFNGGRFVECRAKCLKTVEKEVNRMLTNLYLRLRELLNREEGQGMVEYALILVLIAVVVIVVLIVLGNQVKNVFCNISGGLGQ